MPSNINFGLSFATLFAILALYLSYKSELIIASIFLLLFTITILFTIFIPKKLNFLNIIWFKFGLILGKLISPIILAFIYFIIITPISVVLRIIGRDLLQLKKNSDQTYWKIRKNYKINPKSFWNQY